MHDEDHHHGHNHGHGHGYHHGHDHDHDHPHLGDDHDLEYGDIGRLEDNALWVQDNVSLKSVGIDIGSAGTQVIFSLLKLRRMGEDLSSRYIVISREPIYRSPVALTPYLDEERIDDKALGKIITDAYEAAGFRPEEVDTGIVILTGEAIRRHNARAIGDLLAAQGGEFVCATAGHNMEARLAAYGSGAALVSHERGERILNIDIGGGTTKLAVVENGRVLETAAIYVGGRLLVVDDKQRIVRLDPGGKYLAGQLGFSWKLGDTASSGQLRQLTAWMAQAIITAIQTRPLPPEIAQLYLTAPLENIQGIGGVMFSGGVGEYVYAREELDFGDLGKFLGQALRGKIQTGDFPWPLLPAGECIRATVVGASEHSVQVSGNTIYISSSSLLPHRNLQVLQPNYEFGPIIDADALAQSIRDHFRAFDLIEGETQVALAFRWRGAPSYERIAAFMRGIEQALWATILQGKPIIIVLDGDIAQTLGALLHEEGHIGSPVLVIDGITLQDFDFIDIGRRLEPSHTVPVTIKSLIFK
ncbi:MAG TPA: ethanolamine ammonia-lyase reactivating factor EutA [Acidiferrobacterales bacterium]|nr:ethanolamine ammonia-lyase reactivating factor EutA [Acidiferrobacterales bacterium]